MLFSLEPRSTTRGLYTDDEICFSSVLVVSSRESPKLLKDKYQRCGRNCWIILCAPRWHFLAHIWLFSGNRFDGQCPLVDKTSQRAKGYKRCNLFMEARSSNNSVDIWSPTYLVGHKGPWKLPKKKYNYQAISSKWIFQITLSQPPLLWKMTSKTDTKIHSTDEIYELQQGIDESQNHSIILICIKYVCSVMPLRLIINL